MEPDMKNQKQKKGFLSTIWESMTKTGGCCGSGGNCCGPSQPAGGNAKAEEKKADLKAGDAKK